MAAMYQLPRKMAILGHVIFACEDEIYDEMDESLPLLRFKRLSDNRTSSVLVKPLEDGKKQALFET